MLRSRPTAGLRRKIAVALAVVQVTSATLGNVATAEPFSQEGPSYSAASFGRNECIDCPVPFFQIGDRSLALDTNGHPHVAYAGDHLFYAWFDGSMWQVETVDDAPGIDDIYPSPPSLALDAAGNPHLSYLNATTTALRYARRTAQGWQTETVDTLPAGMVFNYDSTLALDLAGNPHIVYPKNGQLHYVSRTGSGWTVETVDPTLKAEFHVSLALDGADRPHISYGIWRGATGLYLKYAYRSGTVWVTETVEDGFLGEYNSIAVNSQGQPRISYLDYTRSKLKYARRTAAGWQIQVVDDVQWFGGFTSLALDAADNPHISYAGAPGGPRYARWTGALWKILPFDDSALFTSLALDNSGLPHIVYHNLAGRGLGYAMWNGEDWQRQIADPIPDPGRDNSLAQRGVTLAASYYDAAHGDLRVARRDGQNWTVEIADSIGDVGQFSDTAIDRQGNPLVSYYAATHGNLKLAQRVDGRWQRSTVDAPGDVGAYSSLALDRQDRPRVSYYDATNGDLRYTAWDGSRWVLETVDSAGDTGRFTSLALDGNDTPSIAYYDATRGDLKLARRYGNQWLVETVDSAGDVGQHASLAIDSLGLPVISYYDATEGDLKLARSTGDLWTAERIDVDGDAGAFSSLALDAGGQPRISYHVAPDGLRLATRAVTGWTTEAVSSRSVTGDSSLILTPDGKSLVGFYDSRERQFRLASGAPHGVYLPLVVRR